MVEAESLELTEPTRRYPLRRRRRDPQPHFQPDRSLQLDPLLGCPDAIVPEGHLARTVWSLVSKLDTSALEARYSSLGRRGHHPRRVLAVWVYASLVGKHHATKVERALQTDAAFRFLSGGHTISATTLRKFRRENGDFFAQAVEQSTRLAIEQGLVDPEQLSVDSVRVQAEASTKSVRTLKRSKQRLSELEKVDRTALDEQERAVHDEKVHKHAEAVAFCEREGRTSYSTTNAAAALMKFPNGASLPGHRVHVTACGSELRFAVAVLINSAANDYGQLEEAVRGAHCNLVAAGMPADTKIQVAADPGYLSEDDLRFADDNRDWVDVLIHEPPAPRRGQSQVAGGYFGRDDFRIDADGSATCPAGRRMRGPFQNGEGSRAWRGDGCQSCSLKQQCTSARERTLTQRPENERLHEAMRERMAEEGAKERYNRRIATVEPVFSYIEDTMEFRRASSRLLETVRAEVLLKILAYNLSRLAAASPLLLCVFVGAWRSGEIRLLGPWRPLESQISRIRSRADSTSETPL